jgi:Predicted ATP-dependent endonuclease of the OLD family
MLESIKIKGFRGFADEQELKLAKPQEGKEGSGLTVIVGPNNGGKSTIIESFKLMSLGNEASFTEGQRNKKAGDRVKIVLSSFNNGQIYGLKTRADGGSETERYGGYPSIMVLSSRRFFAPYSNKVTYAQDQWTIKPAVIMSISHMLGPRGQPIAAGDNRLFKVVGNEDFNKLLEQILDYKLDWTVDLSNTEEYYIKIIQETGDHDSDGLGEGLVSLLFLVEALLNSSPDKLLVIDEPELSLHPQLQRNLLDILLEKSKDRQIVYATHSPEMVSIDAILNGGTLARVVNLGDGSKIYQLNEESIECLRKFEGDLFNPHVLGYDARACFFENDKLVVVEGQEDVIFLNKALKDLGINKKIRFFGFGAGGAEKIVSIITILKSLGFKKVCCLYDGDKETEKDKVKGKFPEYKFEILTADDIRDKECRYYKTCENINDGYECKICRPKKGIFGNDNKIKQVYEDDLKTLLNRIADLWKEE